MQMMKMVNSYCTIKPSTRPENNIIAWAVTDKREADMHKKNQYTEKLSKS